GGRPATQREGAQRGREEERAQIESARCADGEPLRSRRRREPLRQRRATSWLIRVAAQAAPNPLSMFTTVSPAAQLFSIPRSAASPPKEAPYPTLVGTASTGTGTRPPTTEGRAPPQPAQTTTKPPRP